MDSHERSTATLNAIFEAAVDAIVLADAHGTITDVNPAACSLFLHKREDLIGRSVNILMPESVAQEHDGYMQHHIETGETQIIGKGRDVEGLRKDGSVFPLHLSVGRVRSQEGQSFVAIMHDLTQRLAAQDALARSQRLDAVGQMTGGIAHDFNNLLTVIIGNLELMQLRDTDEGMAALIKDALDAAEMGSDLTSRLMIFARRSNLKPVAADLRTMCEDALAIVKRTIGGEIEIKTEFAPNTRRVLIDPVQLQATLVNLALNARDAMDGRGTLLISVDNVTIDDSYMAQEIDVELGDYVRLSVSDDGAGMDPETQKRAFEPFFTGKSDSGGTGLGLAMVYGFVRQSGGHITLYSEPGLGTSFGLYFPALPDSAVSAPPEKKPAERIPQIDLGKGRTVLIVEDNPKVRALSVARVESLGFRAVEASSADQAYTILQAGLKVDIIFSDLVMPGKLNGYDLAAMAAEAFPGTKILLTSGYASDVVTEHMAQGVSYEILHKPFRQKELVDRLQALLAADTPT